MPVNRFRWFYHPVFIFIFSIVALAASLALYIYWYIEVSTGLAAVIQRYQLDPSQFLEVQTWVVILVLCILMAIILTGVFIIFICDSISISILAIGHVKQGKLYFPKISVAFLSSKSSDKTVSFVIFMFFIRTSKCRVLK